MSHYSSPSRQLEKVTFFPTTETSQVLSVSDSMVMVLGIVAGFVVQIPRVAVGELDGLGRLLDHITRRARIIVWSPREG